jgi:hypothetical protein
MYRLTAAVTPLVLAIAIAACSDAGTAVQPLVGLSAGSPTPLAVEEVPSDAATEASAEPTSEAPTAKPLPVRVTKRTKTVKPGDMASVTIKTKKGAKCSILVEYESGYSEAKGLGDKRANGDGIVTWRWLVGIAANRQKVPVAISCKSGDRTGQVETAYNVP